MLRLARPLALLVAVALALPVAASARHFRGHRYVHNPFGSNVMTVHRAHWAAVRVVRRVFAVRPHTSIFACSTHSRHVGGCDFAFTSVYGHSTCGNAVVRAGKTRFRVRYTAFTRGCGDF